MVALRTSSARKAGACLGGLRASILAAGGLVAAGQLPSRAETRSPDSAPAANPCAARTGPFTCSWRACSASSSSPAKNCRQWLVHGGGVFEILGVELLDELGVAAIEERSLLEGRRQVRLVHRRHFRVWACTAKVLQLPFSFFTKVLPSIAGESATAIPARFIASILDSAPPLPPEMMAPAWPMRRPGGAVRPAMKPAMGFLTLDCGR